MSEEKEYAGIVEVIDATNGITIDDPVKRTLVAELGPIVDRIGLYESKAAAIVVRNQKEAEEAVQVCNDIAADIKTVEGHAVLSKITDGLHKLHRRWTGMRDMIVSPLTTHRKAIRAKVIDWLTAEQERAAAEQRRLQAEADLRARQERERLEKKATEAKRPETQEKYRAAAEEVAIPTVKVEAPKTGLRGVASVWTIARMDEDAFFKGLGSRPDLMGFVTIDRTRLARAKAANPRMEVPGVVFEQRTR